MAYQSFPWLQGDSASYNKLISLQLPNLKGKTFLDVGCNEGFFCGFAQFSGATKVTGVDIKREFLDMAKIYFPECQFICQDWEDLGPEKYDVILCASAIHYAKDQPKLIEELVSRLNPGGTLVLEIGVAPGEENEFKEVRRAFDSRLFPTISKLQQMLDPYASKYIYKSVPQAGDPIPRHVYHIARKLPYATLLLDDPFAGKTQTIKSVFREDMKVISGDRLYHAARNGDKAVPPEIMAIISSQRGMLDCGQITYQICKAGVLAALCQWIVETAGNQDFILDMYIPEGARSKVADYMEKAGYYVVNVSLQKAFSRPRAKERPKNDIGWLYLKHLADEFIVDEEAYLAANPDVAKGIQAGIVTSGQAHYILYGRAEGRKRKPADNSQDSQSAE